MFLIEVIEISYLVPKKMVKNAWNGFVSTKYIISCEDITAMAPSPYSTWAFEDTLTHGVGVKKTPPLLKARKMIQTW